MERHRLGSAATELALVAESCENDNALSGSANMLDIAWWAVELQASKEMILLYGVIYYFNVPYKYLSAIRTDM